MTPYCELPFLYQECRRFVLIFMQLHLFRCGWKVWDRATSDFMPMIEAESIHGCGDTPIKDKDFCVLKNEICKMTPVLHFKGGVSNI